VNLRINAEKCQFFKQELLYLGHRVTSHGIVTDPDKVAAIAQLELPSTVRELRHYPGEPKNNDITIFRAKPWEMGERRGDMIVRTRWSILYRP